jgi:hypothetical protein
MPDKKGPTQATQVFDETALPQAMQAELKLLRGFAVLGAERTAYMFGVSSLTKDMSNATKTERGKLSEASKALRDNIAEWVKKGDATAYEKALETISKARKTLSTKQKPTRDKISPLRKGMKYLDIVVIPEAIKELAKNVHDPKIQEKLVVAPAFKLSEWINTALENSK